MAKKPVVMGTLAEILPETPRVATFVVRLPEETEFTFVSGQFAMLSLPDFLNDKGRPVRRAYSIASSPPTIWPGRPFPLPLPEKGREGSSPTASMRPSRETP